MGQHSNGNLSPFFLGHTHVHFPEQTDRVRILNGVLVDLLGMTSSDKKKVRIQ